MIDSLDPSALARFWAGVLSWQVTLEREDEACAEPPDESGLNNVLPDLLFVRVPSKKTEKNRLHIDLRPSDQEAEVSRIIGLGAKRVDIGQGDAARWVVLADPEGNEFCVLPPLPPS